jgi:hypothetical protein
VRDAADRRQVGIHHHLHQAFEIYPWRPAQRAPGFSRIGQEQIDLGGAVELRIDDHMLAPVQAEVSEALSTNSSTVGVSPVPIT